jgi:adenosylmethionine-8-amino-7-oxononanoate aminotransferase
VQKQGAYLERRLRECFANHHHVGDIRGRGLFRGVEIVEDRASKTPFDPALKLHARIKQTAMDHGLMVYPIGGTVEGKAGDHILLAPPFIVTERDVNDIVDILGTVIDKSIAAAR